MKKTTTRLLTPILSKATLAILAALSFCATAKTVETIADFGPSGYDAVTIDAAQNIYVSRIGWWSPELAGMDGTNVIKLDQQGNQTDFLTGLAGPLGNGFDHQGNFFGSSMDSPVVLKRNAEGVVEVAGTFPEGMTGGGMAVNSHGEVFFSSCFGGQIFQLTDEGLIPYFADEQLGCSIGVAFDEHDNLLMANYVTGQIFKLSPEKTLTLFAQVEENASGTVGYISYMNETIYATGIGSQKIYQIDKNAVVEVIAGNGERASVNGQAAESSFNYPNGIAADNKEKALYISQWGDGQLRKVDLVDYQTSEFTKADAIMLDENQALSFFPTENDMMQARNLKFDTLTVVTPPAHGQVTIDYANGEAIYSSDSYYNGPDSFSYQIETAAGIVSAVTEVSVTVNSVNQAPVSNYDIFNVVLDGESGNFSLPILSNDSDIEDQLSYANVVLITTPDTGTLDLTDSGLIFNATTPGTYRLSYTVSDSLGLSSSETTVTINVSEPAKSNGGSFGFIMAGLFSLGLFRRYGFRRNKK